LTRDDILIDRQRWAATRAPLSILSMRALDSGRHTT
jgi:hypothetical protein